MSGAFRSRGWLRLNLVRRQRCSEARDMPIQGPLRDGTARGGGYRQIRNQTFSFNPDPTLKARCTRCLVHCAAGTIAPSAASLRGLRERSLDADAQNGIAGEYSGRRLEALHVYDFQSVHLVEHRCEGGPKLVCGGGRGKYGQVHSVSTPERRIEHVIGPLLSLQALARLRRAVGRCARPAPLCVSCRPEIPA